MPWLLLGGLILGTINAVSGIESSQSAYDEQVKQLQTSKEDLTTGIENLKSDYTSQVGAGLIDVDSYLNDPTFDISSVSASEIGLLNYELLLNASEQNRQKAITTQYQQKNLSVAGTSQAQLSALETQQIAVQNVQASEAEGQASQAVASSGFRNVGSAQNVVKQQQYYNRVSMDSLKGQVKISRFNRYNDALSAYTQAETQKANYDAAIENQILITGANIGEETRKYNQDLTTLNTKLTRTSDDLTKLEDYGQGDLQRDQFLIGIGSVFSGLLSGLTTL